MQTELFYNTIDFVGEELTIAGKVCQTQEQFVLRCFEKARVPLTAYEVFQITNMACINSTRRAITNLYKQGKLIKTDIKRKGGFGMMNYAYKIK